MTIISTHRSHSYKASASIHRRDVSPKKINSYKTTTSKKHIDKYNTKTNTMPKMLNDAQLLPMLLASLGNYESGFQYKVLLPTDYPYEDTEDVEEITDADSEEMWAHYDYLEWLYD
jgi:hypothetical protein